VKDDGFRGGCVDFDAGKPATSLPATRAADAHDSFRDVDSDAEYLRSTFGFIASFGMMQAGRQPIRLRDDFSFREPMPGR